MERDQSCYYFLCEVFFFLLIFFVGDFRKPRCVIDRKEPGYFYQLFEECYCITCIQCFMRAAL